MDNTDEFERKLKLAESAAAKSAARIADLQAKLNDATANNDERKIGMYTTQLADARRVNRTQQATVEFMRCPENDDDKQYRIKVLNEFPQKVRDAIPDGLPIVFHGSRNIGTVREILRTGGLLTPEQKGESMQSFASAIDVTYKDNIRVSCEFAEPGLSSYMPYGAIFAFFPLESEIENCVKTGESSEVMGGVDGVSFRENPERLYAIITTHENLELVRAWCDEYGLDKTKVVMHNEFLSQQQKTKPDIDVTI